MKLNLAGIVPESIVDGPGIRYVVFAQGCPHHCKGCHNPETHPFTGGIQKDIEEIVEEVKKNPILTGVTFSGGEPFCQAEGFSVLAKKLKGLYKTVHVYTGYTFEELLEWADKNTYIKDLLSFTDILIDGKFEEDKKTMKLLFRGSSNQRLINVPASLKNRRAVTINTD